jgi:drug/metabolite transporter (DMT)-like permease
MSTEEIRERGGLLAGTTVDRPALAASLMVGALFLLGLQDGFVKLTSSEVSLWQFQMIRAAINLVLLMALSRMIWGSARPRPKRIRAVALRSLLLIGAMICFFGGIPFLSLAEIAAGLYVFPLFVAVLSAVLLGERVGPRRIAAILVGFSGTLVILRPGAEAFTPVSLMPVGAALCYAGTILTTRRLCREESPVTLAYGVSVAFLIVGGLGVLVFSSLEPGQWAAAWPYLFTGWNRLDLWVLAIIPLCSLLNLTANIGLAKAYQSAEASWLAPFDYSYLIFATFWGVVFWSDLPDGFTILGMAMIAGAGAFVAWRERRESRFRRANFNRSLR